MDEKWRGRLHDLFFYGLPYLYMWSIMRALARAPGYIDLIQKEAAVYVGIIDGIQTDIKIIATMSVALFITYAGMLILSSKKQKDKKTKFLVFYLVFGLASFLGTYLFTRYA